jgi:hypothetical protein
MHLTQLEHKKYPQTKIMNCDLEQGMDFIQLGPTGTKERPSCRASKKLAGGPLHSVEGLRDIAVGTFLDIFE